MENRPEEFEKAYNKAIQLIKIRPHGRGELVRKLQLRHFNARLASEVTQKLEEQGLINDQMFVEGFVDSLIRFKTFGFYGILAKLRSRNVDKEVANAVLSQKFPVEVEKEVARKIMEREKGRDKVKLAQKLSRKGFRSEVISQVLKEDWDTD